jgi:hypothetical protein
MKHSQVDSSNKPLKRTTDTHGATSQLPLLLLYVEEELFSIHKG